MVTMYLSRSVVQSLLTSLPPNASQHTKQAGPTGRGFTSPAAEIVAIKKSFVSRVCLGGTLLRESIIIITIITIISIITIIKNNNENNNNNNNYTYNKNNNNNNKIITIMKTITIITIIPIITIITTVIIQIKKLCYIFINYVNKR